MNFISHIEKIEEIIVDTVHIILADKNYMTHKHTVFHNLQVRDYSILYKEYKGVYIWLINKFDKQHYYATIRDYLQSNQTPHGKEVFASYLKNTSFFEQQYFGPEFNLIKNKSGLIFTLTEPNDKGVLEKRNVFVEYNFNDE
jgi:hypothetical protein